MNSKDIYTYNLKTGIFPTVGSKNMELAEFACNTGLKCGHGCKYCSTGAMLRAHPAFKKLGLSPFDNNYAIVDPNTPERIVRDARRKRKRGLVQVCTTVDAWSPEAQKYDLGRRSLEAILAQPGWTVRILTRNAAVEKDFDVIEKYRDRVLFGMNITAPPEKTDVISIIEPNASPIPERIEVMKQAADRGLRTYAMFSPLLPGIADEPLQVDELIKLAANWNVEEIFAQPIVPKPRGLILTQHTLQSAGFHSEALCVDSVLKQQSWSEYVVRLIKNTQKSVRKHSDIEKLRFLLHLERPHLQDLARIRKDDAGVLWL